jgi:hypothetical protein
MFWKSILPPSSGFKSKSSAGCLIYAGFLLCFVINLEVGGDIFFSEMSVEFYWTVQHFIAEDGTVHSH